MVAAGRVEERFIGDDPGSDDAGHLPAEEALGRFGIVDLLADGDAAAGVDQLDQLHIELVVGKPGHRHGFGALVAAGEREIEERGRLAGVAAEEFVEISHPKQHQSPRAPELRRLELLHHGGWHGREMYQPLTRRGIRRTNSLRFGSR